MQQTDLNSNVIYLDRYRQAKEDKENFLKFLTDVMDSKKGEDSEETESSIEYMIDHEVEVDDYWNMFYDD